MTFNAQDGAFGLARQGAKGTYESPQFWMKLLSGGVGTDQELMILEPEIGGSRDIFSDGVNQGPVKYSGPLEFVCKPEAFGLLLLGTLGAVASASASSAYEHTFTPADTVPWLSMYEDEGGGYEEFGYTDAIVGKLSLNCNRGDWLKGVADMIAITQDANVSETPGANETTPQFTWDQAVFKIDGTQYDPLDLGFTFDNQPEDDYFALGSLKLIDVPLGRRESGFEITIKPDDSNLQRIANYGNQSLAAPAGAVGTVAVNLRLASYANIPGATTPYVLEVDVPAAVVRPYKSEKGGNKTIENKVMLVPVKTTGQDLMTVTLINDVANYNAPA